MSSYYDAAGDKEALELAFSLFDIIEERCTDEIGYLEALQEISNRSQMKSFPKNGVLADKTMNTLLHVFEAYTELYRVRQMKH